MAHVHHEPRRFQGHPWGWSLFNVQSEFSSFAKKGWASNDWSTPPGGAEGTEGPELALNISANMERLTTAAERMAFPARKRMIDEINAMLPEARKIDTPTTGPTPRAPSAHDPRAVQGGPWMPTPATSPNPTCGPSPKPARTSSSASRAPQPRWMGKLAGPRPGPEPHRRVADRPGQAGTGVEEMSRRNELEFEKWRSAIWGGPHSPRARRHRPPVVKTGMDFSLVQVRQDSPSIVRERTVVEHAIMDPDAASAIRGSSRAGGLPPVERRGPE